MGALARRPLKGISTFVLAACELLGASGCLLGEEEPSAQTLCLPSAAAEALSFNSNQRLEQDDAGNTLLWWWAADDRRDPSFPDVHIQMAAWDGSGFSTARQPDAADAVALRGSGRWLAVRTPDDRLELETWSPDCGRATAAVATSVLPETVPSVATNTRGDLALAWNGVVGDDSALFVAQSPAGGTLSEPQLIFQVRNESIPTHVAVDEAGGAAVAFAKVELVTPELGLYETELVESSGDGFSAPTILADGMPRLFTGDAGNGRLLVARSNQGAEPTLLLQRFDAEHGWTALPDYTCQRAGCDLQFGMLRGGAVLIVERTFLTLHTVVLDADGARDMLSFPEFEVGAAILSHALSVAPDGTARSIWLTEKALHTATFSLDSGWSAPSELLSHPIETDSSWLATELSDVANLYPMRVARLADGRLLAVWSELGDIVERAGGDSVWLEATTQSLWSVVTDGTTATIEAVAGPAAPAF
jgi:hypothetical protein